MVRSENSTVKWPEKIDNEFMKTIVDSLPYDAKTLYELVSVFEFEYSEAIPTASIRAVGIPRILINRAWASEWVLTMADLASVIHHELTHKILDHSHEDIDGLLATKLSEDQKSFLFDVRVQGLAYQLLPHLPYRSIWKRYYADTEWPLCLLDSETVIEGYQRKRLHRAIYSPMGISLENVARFVFGDNAENHRKMGLPQSGDGESGQAEGGSDSGPGNKQNTEDNSQENKTHENARKDDSADNPSDDTDDTEDSTPEGQNGENRDKSDPRPTFIGDHDEAGPANIPKALASDYIKDAKQVVDKKIREQIRSENLKQGVKNIQSGMTRKDVVSGIKSYSPSESEFIMDLDKAEDMYRDNSLMRDHMMRIAIESEDIKAKKALQAMMPTEPNIGSIPNFRDRRAAIMYSLDYWPVFFENTIEDPHGRCQVYIDNSGSQYHVIAYLVRFFSQMRDYLADDVHFFSTKIWTVKRNKIRPGMKIETTGGTDMNCVIEHALDNRYKKIMVVTDGIGPLSTWNAARANASGMKVLVAFTDNGRGSGFDAVEWRHFQIPTTKENE